LQYFPIFVHFSRHDFLAKNLGHVSPRQSWVVGKTPGGRLVIFQINSLWLCQQFAIEAMAQSK
jgi:hypothetical protein